MLHSPVNVASFPRARLEPENKAEINSTVTQRTHCPLADIMELKRMMEKLGQAKTHLELKKMIAEVDKTNSGRRREEEN